MPPSPVQLARDAPMARELFQLAKIFASITIASSATRNCEY
jgi:hypothetical protein